MKLFRLNLVSTRIGYITLLLLFFHYLNVIAQDFQGPESGTGDVGKMMNARSLPVVTQPLSLPHFIHNHSMAKDDVIQQLQNQPVPPFWGNAHPEPDPSATKESLELEPEGLSASFQGITDTGWWPPDPVIAAGQNHVIMVVNSSIAIYTKTGNPLTQSTLLNWFSNVNPPDTIFDPKVLYDH